MQLNSSVEQGPLGGFELVARWDFAYDYLDTWATGEFLLRSDGTLLRRSGGSSYARGQTSYKFGEWEPVSWWDSTCNADAAILRLKAKGYVLATPGPTSIDNSVAGPFPGTPGLAQYL